MFWAFFNDGPYEEHLWPAVWTLEKIIQSLIFADHRSMRQLGRDELRDDIRRSIDEIPFPGRQLLEGASIGWIDSFLSEQLPAIYKYLQSLDDSFVPSRKTLGYRVEMQDACWQKSEGFRRFMESLSPPDNRPMETGRGE